MREILDSYIKEKEEEVKILEDEKIKKIYSAIKQIESEYDRKIKEIRNYEDTLRRSIYLDKYDSFKAIEYLVNQMEGEKYTLKTSPILILGTYLTKMKVLPYVFDCFITYLIKDGNDFKVKSQSYTIDELDIIKDDFILLAYYKKSDYPKVSYIPSDDIKILNGSRNINASIIDDRFSYINDYIKEVIKTKLNNLNFEITFYEMLQIADEFVKTKKEEKIMKLKGDNNE